MLTFILERREELRLNPDDRATAVQTHGIGTTDNTNHLNRTRHMQWLKLTAPSMKPDEHSLGMEEKPGALISAGHTSGAEGVGRASQRPYQYASASQTAERAMASTRETNPYASPSKTTESPSGVRASKRNRWIFQLAMAGNSALNISLVTGATIPKVRATCRAMGVWEKLPTEQEGVDGAAHRL